MSEFDGSTWATYTTADGLASNRVRPIAIDEMGHKWFGTFDGGVSEFDDVTWTTYTTADGLASNCIQAIAIDGAGHKWFGTAGGGVSEFVPDEVVRTVDPTTGTSLVYTDTQGSPTTLVYTPVKTATPPSGLSFTGHAFGLEVYRRGSLLPGFTFSIPVTITIHYSKADVAVIDEGTLELRY